MHQIHPELRMKMGMDTPSQVPHAQNQGTIFRQHPMVTLLGCTSVSQKHAKKTQMLEHCPSSSPLTTGTIIPQCLQPISYGPRQDGD